MTTHSGRSSRTRRGTSESDGVSQVEKFSEDDLGWLEDPNREPELDDQGNWTDEEVERQAFMRRHSRYDPYVEAAEEEDEEDDGEVSGRGVMCGSRRRPRAMNRVLRQECLLVPPRSSIALTSSFSALELS